jgi:putative membrane protein
MEETTEMLPSQMSILDALKNAPGPKSLQEKLWLYAKGLAMGVADLIPGVSGGTIAFVTGIYDDFMAAASCLDHHLLKLIVTFRIKEAILRVPLHFIIPLAAGILTSIFSMARLMHYLLTEHPLPTWGFFFGLIVSSIIIISKKLDSPYSPLSLLMVGLGAIFAYLVVGMIPVETPSQLWFIYLCGIIGITAMILPGISGSFLLLMMGKYEYITAAVKSPFGDGNFIILVVFSLGCATGLVSFSKFLKYVLQRYHNITMCFLTGVLVGSLRKVWPWKEVIQKEMIGGKMRIMQEANLWPMDYDFNFMLTLVMMAVGVSLVLVLERIASRPVE